MENHISTTIEQSKELVRLGLDQKTADMCWVKDYTEQWVLIADEKSNIQHRLEGMYEYSGFKWQEHIALVPAWSLSALLEVMPETIKSDDTQYYFHLEKSVQYNWHFISYYFDDVDELYELKTTKQYENPITAAFEMVCWLLEQGLIKKGGQDDLARMQFELMKSQEEVNALRQEVAEMNEEREYWNQVRIQAAIAAMQWITPEWGNSARQYAEWAVRIADALVAELQKKGGNDV